MLTLIEPTHLRGLTDRPNLGCAMLISTCRQKGFETKLIKAQTRYIRNMFIDDSDELWSLFQDLKPGPGQKRLNKFKKYFQAMSLDQFQHELKTLYEEIIVNKCFRTCLNAQKVYRFLTLYDIFTELYIHFILKMKQTGLRIIKRYVDEIINSSPRYLGYSIRGAFSPVSRAIIKEIKEKMGIPVIVGGSFSPFVNLHNLDKIMVDQGFDYLVVGAGEEALPALLEALEHKKQPEGIANVFYKHNNKVKTNKLEVIEHPDELPFPDFSQFDLDLYLTPVRFLPFQTARGCYWRQCAFCSHHNIDLNFYKTWSVDRVIEMIKHLLAAYSCRNFFIDDEALAPRRARQISEAIISNKLDVRFEVRGRFDRKFNDNGLLKLMKSAGFSSISWGMESGCQRVLDLMQKGIKKEDISEILKKAHENRISNMCFLFCGFPGETREEWCETIDFIKKYHRFIDGISEGVFFLNKYAPIGREPEKWGVTINKENKYTVSSGMSIKEINYYYRIYMDRYRTWRSHRKNYLEYIKSGYKEDISRMMLFFLASHILPDREIKKYLEYNIYENLYPVLLGEVTKEEEKVFFFPVNLEKSFFDNFLEPGDKKVFDRLEMKLFELSDGSHSFDEMIKLTALELNRDLNQVEEKCASFFMEAFVNKWAIFLANEL